MEQAQKSREHKIHHRQRGFFPRPICAENLRLGRFHKPVAIIAPEKIVETLGHGVSTIFSGAIIATGLWKRPRRRFSAQMGRGKNPRWRWWILCSRLFCACSIRSCRTSRRNCGHCLVLAKIQFSSPLRRKRFRWKMQILRKSENSSPRFTKQFRPAATCARKEKFPRTERHASFYERRARRLRRKCRRSRVCSTPKRLVLCQITKRNRVFLSR